MGAAGFINQSAGHGHVFASWLFLRILGLIYLAAFISLATQIQGLAGSQGILPATELLGKGRRWGKWRFHRLPTLCWISSSDRFLSFLAWAGAGLAALLSLGFAPVPTLILLYVIYLSLFTVCRVFLRYQW